MADTTHAKDAAHEAASSAGGLPQLDVSTWGSQIFWLFVTFGALYFILAKFILPALASGITDRSDRIADDLDTAARLQREAEEANTAYERSLADARAKAHNISATTRSSVEAEIASEVEAADADLARQQSAAEARIATIRSEAMRKVDDVASGVTAEILSKLAGVKPTAAAIKSAVTKA